MIVIRSRRFEEKTEHDVEIWNRRFEEKTEHHVEICTHSQDSEDEQKRCVSTADEHKPVSEVELERPHEMMIDDDDDDHFEQAPADQALALSLAHVGMGGHTCLQDTEDDCERCLVCLSSAEVHRLKNISKLDQSSTTTTNNNGRDRDGSGVNVGEHGLGVGKCMSYIYQCRWF